MEKKKKLKVKMVCPLSMEENHQWIKAFDRREELEARLIKVDEERRTILREFVENYKEIQRFTKLSKEKEFLTSETINAMKRRNIQ